MSIVDSAEIEMRHAGFPEDEIAAMQSILRTFFDTWDSGGAVAAMQPVLMRLIAGKPLSPITGADSEWMAVTGGPNDMTWQNRRCGSIFKEQLPSGEFITYDIGRTPNAGVPPNANLFHPWAAHSITFPYRPDDKTSIVKMPVIAVDTGKPAPSGA